MQWNTYRIIYQECEIFDKNRGLNNGQNVIWRFTQWAFKRIYLNTGTTYIEATVSVTYRFSLLYIL